jgi:hypothetical protein
MSRENVDLVRAGYAAGGLASQIAPDVEFGLDGPLSRPTGAARNRGAASLSRGRALGRLPSALRAGGGSSTLTRSGCSCSFG